MRRAQKLLSFTLCHFFFCLTVISLKASEDASFEKKKETWAFFEGRSCMFPYYKMPLLLDNRKGIEWEEGALGVYQTEHTTQGNIES